MIISQDFAEETKLIFLISSRGRLKRRAGFLSAPAELSLPAGFFELSSSNFALGFEGTLMFATVPLAIAVTVVAALLVATAAVFLFVTPFIATLIAATFFTDHIYRFSAEGWGRRLRCLRRSFHPRVLRRYRVDQRGRWRCRSVCGRRRANDRRGHHGA